MTLDSLIHEALAEDLTDGRDLTSELMIEAGARVSGWIEAREGAVLSGLHAAQRVFEIVDSSLCLRRRFDEGARVERDDRVLEVEGSARSILRAERTALNFISHLSGIASRTREYVAATRPWNTLILCTRKTLPGLRDLQIAAVRHGGGETYRTNLSDAVLVKDNHQGIVGGLVQLGAVLEELRSRDGDLAEKVLREGKIEVCSLDEAAQAVTMGWRQLLLDNFEIEDAAEAVRRFGDRVFLEISGGVNLHNVREYAATGVHAISIGALTHSGRAADFSLEVEWRRS